MNMKVTFEFDINGGMVQGVSCHYSGNDSSVNKMVLERLQEMAFSAMHMPRVESLNAHIDNWREDTDEEGNWDEEWDDEWIPEREKKE